MKAARVRCRRRVARLLTEHAVVGFDVLQSYRTSYGQRPCVPTRPPGGLLGTGAMASICIAKLTAAYVEHMKRDGLDKPLRCPVIKIFVLLSVGYPSDGICGHD